MTDCNTTDMDLTATIANYTGEAITISACTGKTETHPYNLENNECSEDKGRSNIGNEKYQKVVDRYIKHPKNKRKSPQNSLNDQLQT